MKRKIFHTPHGRLMMKITSIHRNKYEAVFDMKFKRKLLNEFASGCTQKTEYCYKNRKTLEKGFKRFNQEAAEKLAEKSYEDLPNALKNQDLTSRKK